MKHYIAILRLDHWIKNVFVLPGAVIALVVLKVNISATIVWDIFLAVLASAFVASANYCINEWLDRHADALHPNKHTRPAVLGAVHAPGVYALYTICLCVGLSLGATVNIAVLVALLLFTLSGLAYNVQPIRAKDKVYIDVIVESANNPIRMFIGWFAVNPDSLIPLSLGISYWCLGAFMMTAKRLSEWHTFETTDARMSYRPSLGKYSAEGLSALSFMYALATTATLSIFAARYHFELVLWLPFFMISLTWYYISSLGTSGLTEHPERLLSDKRLLGLLLTNFLALLVLLSSDIAGFERIFTQSISIR